MPEHFRSCTVQIGECLCEFKRSWIILGITAVIFIAEVIGGIYSGSLALLSDAGHVFGDFAAIATAIVIAYLVFRRSEVERNARGAGAYIHGFLLIGVAGWVFFEALRRMHDEREIEVGAMMAVAVFGALGNIAQHKVLVAGSATVTREGMRKHIVSDFLQSIAVIVSAPLIALTGKTVIDLIASVVIAAWMLKGGVELVLLGRDAHARHGH